MTKAELIARVAHVGQTEQSTGDDYILHIERVVALVADDPDEKAAAWLHDVLEDTNVSPENLLTWGIPEHVVNAVVLLTRSNTDRAYEPYIDSVRFSWNRLAISVKIADLRDHLRPDCPGRLRPRYEAALPLLLRAKETQRCDKWYAGEQCALPDKHDGDCRQHEGSGSNCDTIVTSNGSEKDGKNE